MPLTGSGGLGEEILPPWLLIIQGYSLAKLTVFEPIARLMLERWSRDPEFERGAERESRGSGGRKGEKKGWLRDGRDRERHGGKTGRDIEEERKRKGSRKKGSALERDKETEMREEEGEGLKLKEPCRPLHECLYPNEAELAKKSWTSTQGPWLEAWKPESFRILWSRGFCLDEISLLTVNLRFLNG